MKLKKIKPGMEVRVTFWDHSQDCDEGAILCVARGEVIRNTKRFIEIAAWTLPDRPGDRVNMTVFAILKTAIKRIENLVPMEMDGCGKRC